MFYQYILVKALFNFLVLNERCEEMNDRELFEGIKQKDTCCLEQFIEKYTSYIAKIVTLVGGKSLRKQDIEEITADVFISVWQNAEKINLIGNSMKSYLGAIARNKTKTVLYSKKVELLPLNEDILFTDILMSDEIAEKETYELVNRTICEMEEPDREIFIRRYFFFEKIREIAEHLSMNNKTVETRLLRGREKLKSMLVERGIAQ